MISAGYVTYRLPFFPSRAKKRRREREEKKNEKKSI
jgi:hypothetical protein